MPPKSFTRWVLAGAVVGFVQACVVAAAPPAATPERLEVPPLGSTLTAVQVAPRDTDPDITGWPNKHLVAFDPGLKTRDQLFLFLPGTGADPATYSTAIVKQAAANGFDTVSLSYPSTFAPTLCAKSTDPACYVRIREQILTGGSADPRAAVSAADSLQNRLVKLLQYLDPRYPAQGWGRFLDGSSPRWSAIRLAGHSQGASMTAFIAMQHEVARATLFSGPTDVSPHGALSGPPYWVAGGGATPAAKYYAFTHLRDESGVDFFATWTALGLKGAASPVLIDDNQTPFRHAHVLVTNAPAAPIAPRPGPETTLTFHLIVAGSRLLPLTPSGQPVFAPAWQYLCFA